MNAQYKNWTEDERYNYDLHFRGVVDALQAVLRLAQLSPEESIVAAKRALRLYSGSMDRKVQMRSWTDVMSEGMGAGGDV